MRKILFAFGVAFSAVLVGVGFVWLIDYSNSPSVLANVAPILPPGVFPKETNDNPKFVVFIHPRCSFSRTTLNELSRLVGQNQKPADIKIVFYRPELETASWIDGDLLQTAQKIPNVAISIMNKSEIESFGVVTSGQTIVYDALGNLEFSGGITESGGNKGVSIGRASIESILNGEEPAVRETPVFGCLLTPISVEF